MYVPHFNAIDDAEQIRALAESASVAQLITTGADGYPRATLLPVVWDGDRLVMHFARANDHWREIADDSPGLAVVTAADAYVSPAWYASKAEHGRVVPTWNYSAVHLLGRVTVHDDPEWLRAAVTALTDLHEGRRAEPWAVTDAPEDYIDKQLRAIVGVELAIEHVEGKAKLSQNRTAEDRAGVVAGMRREGGPLAQAVADAMASDQAD